MTPLAHDEKRRAVMQPSETPNTTYHSKPTEVEAMQWTTSDYPDPPFDRHTSAEEIVAWVNANGGEARYEPHYPNTPSISPNLARIAVRTINDWAYAAPGDYVVMGDKWFRSSTGRITRAMTMPADGIRDFYPVTPATFKKRWEPAS